MVLVMPADGTAPRLESLGTVKEDLTDSTLFYYGYVDSLQGCLAEKHRFLNTQTCLVQPLIRLQPDVCKNYWPHEAWRKRAVVSMTGYHIFFTVHSGNGLSQNTLCGGLVDGDVFVLKLSDGKGEGDARYYVDLDVGRWESKRVLLWDVAMEIINVKNQYEQLVMEKGITQLMMEKRIISRSSPV